MCIGLYFDVPSCVLIEYFIFSRASRQTSTEKTDCTNKFCSCFHTLNVKTDSLVELVLIDKGDHILTKLVHINLII